MNILTIPIRNTLRKPWRTLLLLLVFTLGVASIISLNFVSKVVGESLEKKLTAFGANILVSPKTETLTVSYGGFNLGNLLYEVRYLKEDEVTAKIRDIHLKDRISSVAPKLVAMAQIKGVAAALVGVRWDEERALKGYWNVQGAYPEAPGQLLAGKTIAERLNLAPGASIEALGTRFTVSGVLDPTGSDDDNVLLADLTALQQAAGRPNQVNFIEVAALCAGCPIEEITAEIGHMLPDVEIKALRNVVQQRMYSVEFVKRLILSVSLVILLTACSMVGLSMMSSVSERKKEIGILRSLGYSKGAVFGIFSFEALLIGVGAGALGYLGGFAISGRILEALDIGQTTAVAFEPWQMLAACALLAVLSMLSCAAPAYKASRIEPSEALITL